jgi:hypothetical protein
MIAISYIEDMLDMVIAISAWRERISSALCGRVWAFFKVRRGFLDSASKIWPRGIFHELHSGSAVDLRLSV